MKRFLFIILIIATIWLIGWAAIFYWKNLRGIWPALLGPAKEIAKLINQSQEFSGKTGVEEKNKTGIPLKLPPGFSISIFASNLGGPRVMTYDSVGNLIVSLPSLGKVVALPDRNSDGLADEVITIIDGLNRPHGLAMKCKDRCQLYIAESDQVAVYDYDEKNLKAINKKKIINLPGGGNHFTRTIMFMPVPNEDKLLISVGSSCNVCYESDWRRAKILVANTEGSNLKVFASGLRNSVFMAIHPVTGKIWATEMGRDWLGDDLPPDELNIIEEGKDYGWPICYGKNIHDLDFDKKEYIRDPCAEKNSSYIDIPAHSAPLGLAFIPEEGWPKDYWYNLLVAFHGSWNRTVPTGYKIIRYKLDAEGKYLGEEDFISGWLTPEGRAFGRPVDILIQPGGIIYISDDKLGVIYRMVYSGFKN